jgi:hypothetical protein
MLFIAGRRTTPRDGRHTYRDTAANSAASLHELFIGAFSVFENWPEQCPSLHRWRADQRRSTATPRRDLKFRASKQYEYGDFYYALHGKLTGAQFAPLRRAYSTYIREHRQREYAQT